MILEFEVHMRGYSEGPTQDAIIKTLARNDQELGDDGLGVYALSLRYHQIYNSLEIVVVSLSDCKP